MWAVNHCFTRDCGWLGAVVIGVRVLGLLGEEILLRNEIFLELLLLVLLLMLELMSVRFLVLSFLRRCNPRLLGGHRLHLHILRLVYSYGVYLVLVLQDYVIRFMLLLNWYSFLWLDGWI